METFKAYFKKEILESKRQFRYLIVFLAFSFISLSSPIIVKLLPKILESSGMPIAIMNLPNDKLYVMGQLINDLFEMGVLVMVFTFCNIISDELNSEKFVLPFSKGAQVKYIVAAKVLHYSITIFAAVALGLFLNYYYVALMFNEGASPAISGMLFSSLLITLFFILNLMLTMFFSIMLKKGIFAGIIVAILQYFSPILVNIKSIKNFVPYNLLESASGYTVSNMTVPIIIAIFYIAALGVMSTILLKKKEVI